MTKAAYILAICRDSIAVSSKFVPPYSERDVDLFSAMIGTLNEYAVKAIGFPLKLIDFDSKTITVYHGMENPSILVWALTDSIRNIEAITRILHTVFINFLDRKVESLGLKLTEIMEGE